jgi:SpoVK/Ycf46/Vps4 family AAA+-type ATPase
VKQAKGVNDDAVAAIIRDKRHALRRTPALTFHDESTALADVGGLGELKRWLRERRRAFSDEARNFGVPTPRGLLLLGVQGCGKSLSAKAVAREWQFPLLRLDLAAAFGSGSQRPEAVLREAIQVAESVAPAVLWIDEIEKALAQGSAGGEDGGVSRRVFGSFLTWLQEKRADVFVVATANQVRGLPPELMRKGRFDEIFFVDLPEADERRAIFEIHLSQRKQDPSSFSVAPLLDASEGFSGAEIEQAVVASLYRALHDERPLDTELLLAELNATLPLSVSRMEEIGEIQAFCRERFVPVR